MKTSLTLLLALFASACSAEVPSTFRPDSPASPEAPPAPRGPVAVVLAAANPADATVCAPGQRCLLADGQAGASESEKHSGHDHGNHAGHNHGDNGGGAVGQTQETGRVVDVMVHGGAFVPDKITATEGERLTLKFVRHDTGGCTKEVVFPSLGIRKELPTGETVVIDLPPLPAGDVKFECGMGMVKGTISVAPKK